MNTKTVPLIIGAVMIVAVGALVFMNMRPGSAPADQTPPSGNSGEYTATEVATHKDASSCWSIIDSNVYDLTSWIGQHPGGQAAIKGLCGHDGTAAFHGQHDDAQQQADVLATFKIGKLKQ